MADPERLEELSKSHLKDEPVIDGPPEVAAPAPDPLLEDPADGFDARIDGVLQEI